MLKLYSCSAASMLVLMVPLPDCTPLLILSLSISVSHASTGWLMITLMDEQTRREVVSLSLELVEVQCPTTPTWSPPIASRLWHIISPVICGQIEVEGDKEIFCPHENRWMLRLCRLSRGLFFFPSWWTLLLYKGLVSCSIMDSWWLAITAHFQKPRPANFFVLFWGGWHRTDCSFRKVLYIIL